jgi:hypothetical protein
MTPEQRARIGASIITSNIPGSIVTSGYRNPITNTRVGGVMNSDHLWGGGIDFQPPKGVSNKQAIDMLRASGADIRTAIDESDHVHVSFNKGFENGLNNGKALIEQGKQTLMDIGNWSRDFANGAVDFAKDPVGTIGDVARQPFDDWFKRIGIGLLGFIMIAAVVFSMTKTDAIKLITR